MRESDLAALNKALGLGAGAKDASYRPYCLIKRCSNPRMVLETTGFKCPACGNRIGFDLKRLRTPL